MAEAKHSTLAFPARLDEERALLYRHLQGYLARLEAGQRVDVLEALQDEGKLLHEPALALDGRWALLSFCLARDLKPTVDLADACKVALAVECLICATDLCDDVMDGEATPLVQRLGVARLLNVALTLFYLAQHILHDLTPSRTLTYLLDQLQGALLRATAGQQRDLLAEGRSACEFSREDCLAIASAKAGTLLGLACRFGAICADASKEQIRLVGELGRRLGIAAQLDNDAHDLSLLLLPFHAPASRQGPKSDLARGKKTLPIVLAAHSLHAKQGLTHTQIDLALRQFPLLNNDERTVYLQALREGMLATWGIALLYRERARECLAKLATQASLSPALHAILGLSETSISIE